MPEYGIDAPYMGVFISVVVAAAFIAAVLLRIYGHASAKEVSNIIFSFATTSLIIIFLIIIYIRREKFLHNLYYKIITCKNIFYKNKIKLM